MEVIEDLVTDPELMDVSHFYAERKWLVEDGKERRLVDEPWTGDMWWDIEVSFPIG